VDAAADDEQVEGPHQHKPPMTWKDYRL
jgi:hypothetical protein